MNLNTINLIIKQQKFGSKNLVAQITNIVTVHDNANIALFLNSSPIVITNGEDEYDDIIKVSSALLLNIGTLKNASNFIKALLIANKYNVPVILDPVGVGASRLRTNCVNELLSCGKIALIRGNYSEILSIANLSTNIQGVDSLSEDTNIKKAINIIIQKHKCIVVASGPKDYIGAEDKIIVLNYDIRIFSSLTGSGCNLSATCASFIANNYKSENTLFDIIISAVVFFLYCGYLAHDKQNIIDFYQSFLNNIYSLSSIDNKFWAKIN